MSGGVVRGPAGSNDCRIYVGNLPPDIRSKDIEDLFYKYGAIRDIDLKNRRGGPPFAFVQFEDPRWAAVFRHVYVRTELLDQNTIPSLDGYMDQLFVNDTHYWPHTFSCLFVRCELKLKFQHGAVIDYPSVFWMMVIYLIVHVDSANKVRE